MATAKLLDDITECPICTEVFKDPRVLPCVHTYCLQCIEKYGEDKQPGDELPCPLCRKEFTVPDNGLSELPKHFFVVKLLHIKDLSDAKSKSSPCEACSGGGAQHAGNNEGNMAKVYCTECQQKFCETCCTIHNKMSGTSRHKTIKIGDQTAAETIASAMPPARCDKHKDETLKIYCFDCKLTICMLCYIELHNSHKCSDINKVVDEFREQMEQDVEQIALEFGKCREMLQKLEKEQIDFDEQAARTEKDISKKAEEVKKMIERHKQELIDELTSVKQKRMKQIESLREEIERQLMSMESYKKYVEELREKGTACDIAKAASGLHDRAQELLTFDVFDRSLSDMVHTDIKLVCSKVLRDDTKNILGEISSEAKPQKPMLTHIVPKGNNIGAVTSLGNDVFVVRYQGGQQVEVYDAATFALQRRLSVPELGTHSYGLVACASNKCLYVSDYNNSNIHRVELTGSNAVTKWSVASFPAGLSVNSAQNLLVACCGAKKLQEFTTDSSMVREVHLQGAAASPWQAIQLSSGQFVVSQNKSSGMVSLVGPDSKVVRNYGHSHTSNIQQIRYPRSFAVAKSGEILVADWYGNKLLSIDASLSSAAELVLPVQGGIQQPSGLWLDEARGRLYVGEWGRGRLLVFDGVFLPVRQ